jgi:cytochrome bd-type quinol oxidase subunit 2
MCRLLRGTVFAFIEDDALSRGAAIAFYTATSIAPILLVVIAGLAFGGEAARGAITAQLSGLMGQQTATILQSAVASSGSKLSATLAAIIGIVTVIATVSGIFSEMQSALNRIWHDQLIARMLALIAGIIAKAQRRGEVRKGDPRLYAFSILGPIATAVLFHGVWRLSPLGPRSQQVGRPTCRDELRSLHCRRVVRRPICKPNIIPHQILPVSGSRADQT